MMKYGPQSLTAVRRRVEGRDTSDDGPIRALVIGMEQIKTTFIVLLQHNLITMERAPASPIIIYTFIVERAVRRLRFPRFLLVVRNEFGDKGVGLMQELFISGRLKRDDLIEDAVKCLIDFENEMDETLEEEDEEAKGARRAKTSAEVQSIFDEMVNKRYIIPQGPVLTPYEAGAKTEEDGKLFMKREKKQHQQERSGEITVKKNQDDGYSVKGDKNEMPLELRLMMNAGEAEEESDDDKEGGPKRKAGAAGGAAKKRRVVDDANGEKAATNGSGGAQASAGKGKGKATKKNNIAKSIQAEQVQRVDREWAESGQRVDREWTKGESASSNESASSAISHN
jgi:hypothetical protein